MSSRYHKHLLKLLKGVYWFFYHSIPTHGKHNVISGYCRRKRIVENNNEIFISENCSFDGNITVYGNNNVIKIEDGVVFKSGSIWVEDDNNSIVIGRKTTIENAEIAVAEGT